MVVWQFGSLSPEGARGLQCPRKLVGMCVMIAADVGNWASLPDIYIYIYIHIYIYTDTCVHAYIHSYIHTETDRKEPQALQQGTPSSALASSPINF